MSKTLIAIVIGSCFLTGCDQRNVEANDKSSKELVNSSIANMIPVQGGEFLMGDFGPLVGENLPFSIQLDDKKLHKVVLSDFSISKFKVTNGNYNKYLKIRGEEELPVGIMAKRHPSLLKDDYPAGVIWQQAKDYCQWSRGKYLPFATNDGKFSPGKNVPSQDELDQYTDGLGIPIYPIGKYSPNPLGLYDMGLSGSEWTNDWYAADYYSNSPIIDPQGPIQGTDKVLRGNVGGDRQYSLTMFRQSSLPIPKVGKDDDYKKYGVGPQYVFRCVINK